MSADLEYYKSLLTQGYTADQALYYTRHYFPSFTLDPHTPPVAMVGQGHQLQYTQYVQSAHQTGQGTVIFYPEPKNQILFSRNFWIGAGIAGLVILVSIVVLIATLFANIGNILTLDETPEFGFRHDVDASLYEDLGANRYPFNAGADYPEFSSTVNVYGADSSGEYWTGSGVIISPYWVLTAAHVAEDLVASETGIFVGIDVGMDHYDDILSVQNIFIHPGWEGDSELMESGVDIALIELSQPVDTEMAAIAIWDNLSTSNRLSLGSTVYTAGYGVYDRGFSECSDYCLDDGDGEYSQRRAWANVLDRIVRNIEPSHEYPGNHEFNGGFIVYDFDSPEGEHNSLRPGQTSTLQQGSYAYAGEGGSDAMPLGMEGTSVQGDSGGPTYAYLDGNWTVIGLTAHGSETANYGDVAFNTHVSSHTEWICSYYSQSRPIQGCNSE